VAKCRLFVFQIEHSQPSNGHRVTAHVVRVVHFVVCRLLKGLGAPWLPSPARGKIIFSPPHLLSASVERTASLLCGGLPFVTGYGAASHVVPVLGYGEKEPGSALAATHSRTIFSLFLLASKL
jgi:hypothetical protein